jgi:hypothetical protein
MVEPRFAFDLLFFVAARRRGWRRFFEAPVRVERRFTSTISPRAVAQMVLDTLAIAFRRRLLRVYDRPVVDQQGAELAPSSTLVGVEAGV